MLTRNDIHIIAEAGTNNNGRLSKAKNLAKIAKQANVDSVKFQIINPWGLYLPGEYEYGNYDINEVIKIRQKGQMTDNEYSDLSAYCKEIGISFTASIFDSDSLDLLMKFEPEYIKFASCDLNHVQLLRQAAEKDVKLVISTGMSTFADVEKTVNELAKINFSNFVLLHCVSCYPAALSQTNLKYIKTLKDTFKIDVGFSDHTETSIAACMALQYGATWFEKHFTEDRNQKGLDHAYAMDPDQLSRYANDITMALEATQCQERTLSEAELYTRKRARRSLYAAKNLPKGHVISPEDVLIVRPEGEMTADEIDTILERPLTAEIKMHQPFKRELIG